MVSYGVNSAVRERKSWSIETVPAVLSEHVAVLKEYIVVSLSKIQQCDKNIIFRVVIYQIKSW